MPSDRPTPEERGLHVVPVPVHAEAVEAVAPDFIPLRLTLQPAGPSLDVARADVVLGRHSQADVRLPLPDVSRRHCRFVWSEGAWRVIDLQSLNGTFVNNQPVEEAALRPGDMLRIGGFTFAVALAVAPEQTAAYTALPPINTEVLQSIADAIPSSAAEQMPRRRAS